MDKIQKVTIEQFENNKDLRTKYGSYESYKNSIYEEYSNKLEKHNRISEALIARYKGLEQIWRKAKKQSNEKIGGLMKNYNVSSKNELSEAISVSLFDSSVYNKANKSVRDAEINYEAALSTALYFSHDIVT